MSPPRRIAVAGLVLWIAALTVVFLLLNVPEWWFQLAERKGVPGARVLLSLRELVVALFSDGRVF